MAYGKPQKYEPPSWAKRLSQQPKEYIQLAMRPTPIHKWELPGVPSGFEVFVKRDDMTGSTLSGSKIRKVEFLLAEALEQGCDCVVTCGSIHSNHCRTTALAARQLGLDTHLIVKWPGEMNPETVGTEGNTLLDRLACAKMVLVPFQSYRGGMVNGKKEKGVTNMMLEYSDKLKTKGHVPYVLPMGGSSPTGSWGYIEAFREMMEQGVLEKFDDIVMPVASGGTVCGVATANYLTGSKLKVHAVCVTGDARRFYDHISGELEAFGLTTDDHGQPIRAQDLVDIIDGYVGLGYGKSTDKDLVQLIDISGQTGIVLEPIYTLKGVQGMLGELNSNPGRFAGKRILYIHTGGVFTLFAGALDKLVKEIPKTNEVSTASYFDIASD